MKNETSVMAILAAALGALCSYASALVVPLAVLIAVMLADYASGMAKAWSAGKLCSKTGLRGILKKLGYLVLVGVAGVVDWLVRYGLTQVGVEVSFQFLMAAMVIVWLIINELISILENVAALGEFWKGGGQGCDNMVFVTLGTGVGGGIVVEGKLLHGAHGSGAEIGPLVLSRDETVPCNCGKRGCVEQYCSATGIVRLAKRHLDSTDAPSSLRTLKNLTCKDIFDAGKAGDKEALIILDRYYAYMGEFLGDVCTTVDPEVVVIGGGVSKAGQVLIDGIIPYFHKYVFHAASGARFTLASLGNDAGAYGAFKLALDAFHA